MVLHTFYGKKTFSEGVCVCVWGGVQYFMEDLFSNNKTDTATHFNMEDIDIITVASQYTILWKT